MQPIDFSALHFLIVDDAQATRRIARNMLQGFGARRIDEAADGAEGLDLLERRGAGIVILDWVMPILDGIEFMRLVRKPANRNAYVPVIMISRHNERAKVMQARDAGITEYLIKPFSAKGLYDRVANILLNPRPFISTKTFFGPDRRRFVNPNFVGEERRKDDGVAELD